ncbi:unnamed protein product [Tenebrio molitor]|nr:unnamed protein product [Tenebrio molitor]
MTVYPVTRKMKEIITITCIVFLQQHTCKFFPLLF